MTHITDEEVLGLAAMVGEAMQLMPKAAADRSGLEQIQVMLRIACRLQEAAAEAERLAHREAGGGPEAATAERGGSIP